MALQRQTSNTLTADGTAQTLATLTDPGVYLCTIDTANLAAGDTIEVSIRSIVLPGGTERDVYRIVFANAQVQPIKISPPLATDQSFSVDLEQTGGTNRDYPWAIERLG